MCLSGIIVSITPTSTSWKKKKGKIYSFDRYSQCFMLELIKLYISLQRNGGNKEFHINYISINLHISLFFPSSFFIYTFTSNIIFLSLSLFQDPLRLLSVFHCLISLSLSHSLSLFLILSSLSLSLSSDSFTLALFLPQLSLSLSLSLSHYVSLSLFLML